MPRKCANIYPSKNPPSLQIYNFTIYKINVLATVKISVLTSQCTDVTNSLLITSNYTLCDQWWQFWQGKMIAMINVYIIHKQSLTIQKWDTTGMNADTFPGCVIIALNMINGWPLLACTMWQTNPLQPSICEWLEYYKELTDPPGV